MTLHEFLLARIADDEERLICHRVGCQFIESDTYGDCDCGGPARVRAECAAKRAVVDLHKTIRAAYEGTTIESDPCCRVCSAGGEYPDGFPCSTLLALAVPYADHPDYREEWRP